MLTNKTSLPSAIFDYLNNDSYSRGDAAISVTALLDSPRVVTLTEAHHDEIEEDVADMSYSLLGKAIHEAIASKGNGEFDDKRRLFMDVLGWRISGQTDSAVSGPCPTCQRGGFVIDIVCHTCGGSGETYTIYDFKTGRMKKEHEQQLNCYRALFEANGYHVSALKVIKIELKWTPFQKATTPHSIYEIDIPLWDLDDAYEFILERVGIHQQARKELPLCTDEERWVEPDRFAVVKVGNVRATATFDEEQDAEVRADELTESTGIGHVVELRVGDPTPKRCYLWSCRVRDFCDQYKMERDS